MADFDTKDKKPLNERKTDERSGYKAAGTADANRVPRADENTIGSPELFLGDRFRQHERGAVRIHQVGADGNTRAYVISEGSKVGYFELAEGMSRPEAEEALNSAFDQTSIVV